MNRFDRAMLTIVESLVLLGIPLIGHAALITAGLVALLLATHLLVCKNSASRRGRTLRRVSATGNGRSALLPGVETSH